MKIGELGGNFFLRISTVPSLQLGKTEQHKKIQIMYLKNCLYTFTFFPISVFPLILWASTKIEPS